MSLTPSEIRAARQRLEGLVHRTPVLRCSSLDQRAGRRLFLKAENLQRAGSFKIRGAYNKIVQVPEKDRRRGVISYSSGNHAQGVALAAQILGVPATIAVPENIVASKRAAAEAYGAQLVEAGTTSAERMQHAEAMAERDGLTLVPPYDDLQIMAGQGTLALEFLDEVPDLDTLVMPIGGGGLAAGCATAARDRRPELQIIGVEPAGADDTARSLAAGKRVRIPAPTTIADGLRAVEPGTLTFPILAEYLDAVVTVTDADILDAVAALLERAKLVVEPSGAAALAAVLAGRFECRGDRVGVVLSGGNVALPQLADLLAARPHG